MFSRFNVYLTFKNIKNLILPAFLRFEYVVRFTTKDNATVCRMGAVGMNGEDIIFCMYIICRKTIPI